MCEIAINLVFEDAVSQAVLVRLLASCGKAYLVGSLHEGQGFGWIRKRIVGFNGAAKGMPYLVLTDLEMEECAPLLVRSWLGRRPKHPNLLFRVAVREVEAWLLGSREEMAAFLGVEATRIPRVVDEVQDPKLFLVNLARHSRKAKIRRDIVPQPGSTARIGPAYNDRLIEFIETQWTPHVARQSSPSLDRTMKVLADFRPLCQT